MSINHEILKPEYYISWQKSIFVKTVTVKISHIYINTRKSKILGASIRRNSMVYKEGKTQRSTKNEGLFIFVL